MTRRVPLPLLKTLHESEVLAERRIWCRQYAACLNDAEAAKWPSFTCTGCEVRDEVGGAERFALAIAQTQRQLSNHNAAMQENGTGRTAQERRLQISRAHAKWNGKRKSG